MKKLSPIDKVFSDIFGFSPEKSGTAYEILSCVAEKMMTQGDVQHDEKLLGEFSETLYQIDILSKTEDERSMGEAKDYTIQNKKVGRGDLQKLGGALPDLKEITKGKFFSATGFTKPAQKYAEASSKFSHAKPIELYDLRPSVEKDEEGTIKTICINMNILIPDLQSAKWIPHFTVAGQNKCKEMFNAGIIGDTISMCLENFFDSSGNVITTISDLTSLNYGTVSPETMTASGCYLIPNHYMQIEGNLVEMYGLEYEVPYREIKHSFEITDDSNCRLTLSGCK